MGIAYLPIDLNFTLPDEQDIIDFCNSGTPLPKDFSPCWDTHVIYSRLKKEDWYNVDTALYEIRNKTVYREDSVGRFYDNFDVKFPVFSKELMQLPFKDISYMTLFRQTSTVGAHYDRIANEVIDETLSMINEDPARLHLEPKRYNILLTKFDYKSFFVSETDCTDPVYPEFDKNTPCFAFSLDEHAHGATYAGDNKIMLFISGSLDEEKHVELIQRSLEKYSNKVIRF